MKATKGEKHLDDVFRVLYDKYYLGLKRGFTDQEYQDAVAEVAGRRFDDFFRNSVYGTQTLDYATALGYAGLTLTSTPLSPEQQRPGRDHRQQVAASSVVTAVVRDGAAWRGGLNVNDEVLQMNGQALGEETLKLLTGRPPGTEIRLQVRRDGLPRDLVLKMQPNGERSYAIAPMPNPTAAQQKVLAKWLGR